MDFALSEQEKLLRADTLEFAARYLSDDSERSEVPSHFSRESWNKCVERGFLRLPLPREDGGLGRPLAETAAVIEALGAGCSDRGLVFSLCAHWFGCIVPVWKFASPRQRTEHLPAMLEGSRIAAHAMTESEAGSDVVNMATTAVKVDGGYLLEGEKVFVTNAPIADLIICYARTAPSLGYLGISAFVIPVSTPGVEITEQGPRMGLRTSPMGTIRFHRCFLPEDARIGEEGNGGRIFDVAMNWERSFLFAFYVGMMDRQLDITLRYAAERKRRGRPLHALQSVSQRLAVMKLRLEASRLLLQKSVWSLERGSGLEVLDSCLSKLFISEAAVRSACDALQIHGARGILEEQGLERMVRDALPSRIFSGTSEVLKETILRELLRDR
jgi:L-prolyl-PCP dehydrogenase